MKPETRLQQAGFHIRKNDGLHVNWGVTPEVFQRSARYRQFIKEALLKAPDQPGVLAARLVVLDAVPVSALPRIERQQGIPHVLPCGIGIEWSAEDSCRLDRRLLSAATLKAWPASPPTAVQLRDEVVPGLPKDLEAGLDAFLARSKTYNGVKNARMELERDSLAWWHEALPPSLFMHAADMVVLTALPRGTWARLQTLKVAVAAEETAAGMDTDVGATGEMLDAALDSEGEDRGTFVLQTALDMLSEKASPVDGVNKRTWALNLLGLRSRGLAAGPKTALLLAWLADLCEHGTSQQSNPADTTVQLYARRTLIPLYHSLAQHPLDLSQPDWSATRMSTLYEAVIRSQSPGNQGTVRSALSAFHDFLVRHFDLPPLSRPLRTDAVEIVPHAQVVWPHEVERAIAWCDAHPDFRVGGAAALMLAIASDAPCRSEELQRLRCRNVRFCADAQGAFVELEIARAAISGRLKTLSSQRRLTLRSRDAVERLARWLERRHQEGATPDAYLFGDPALEGQRYKTSATTALANRMLRAATGAPDVSLHSLRHTVLSRRMAEHWNSHALLDINPLEVHAAEAGHATPMTTLLTYSHDYEQGMRLWLDVALLELVQLNSREAARATGQSSDSLRARASRSQTTIQEVSWRALRQIGTATAFPAAAADRAWVDPAAPAVAARNAAPMTLDVVMALLRSRVVDRVTPPTLAHRHDLDPARLDRWERSLTLACAVRAKRIFPRKHQDLAEEAATLHQALQLMEIDLARLRQPKFAQLVNGLGHDLDPQTMHSAVQSWEQCHKGEHISLENASHALGLLRLLRACKVDPAQLRICLQSTPGSTESTQLRLLRQEVEDVFIAALGRHPRVEVKTVSRNRPSAYLQWDNPVQPGTLAGASGGSIAGLHAAMLCVKAYLLFKELS